MPRKGEGKWMRLLEDEDVRRWYENLARGSRATADNYLRVLGRFLQANALTPRSFIAMNPRKRDDILADHIEAMLKRGRAGSYVAVYKKTVVSWLDWNGKRLTRKIQVPGTGRRPRLEGAHIPSQEELKRVLNVADVRARTAVSLMAFSGLREEVLGTYLGDDGLRVRDLPEVRIEDGRLTFDAVPTRVVVPERLSKTGRPYFTFLGPEGCEYLAAYFLERSTAGEVITPDSPVITPRDRHKPFIRTINIGDLIRKPMRAAGLGEPPYIWRSYFASRAMLAEAKGLLRDYRQFFMGHKGDIEHVDALHKIVPPDTVEAMRGAYEAALEYLETVPSRREGDPTTKMISLLLQAAGYSQEQIDEMNIEEMSEEKIIELLRGGSQGVQYNGGRPMQRMIHMNELADALAQGWMFRAALPDNRVIVERV